MQRSDRAIASSIFLLLLAFWLGFLVHRSPRFAGSAWGGFFGVSGALFMLVPLAYTLVKRSALLRRRFTRRFSFQSLLHAHIYLGLIGALLGLVHSGHKFQSVLGVALTAMMLLSVISGFIGKYFLGYVTEDIRQKQTELGVLRRNWETISRAAANGPLEPALPMAAAAEVLPVATAVAELEYTLRFQDRVRKLFNVWLLVHIVCSLLFYLLLVLHVWAGIEFGLRWFD
jgi:hypothetical protein